ncbi:hypothetical protein D1BOALGB6SA_1723 [Olavius sp. associated proteobacterium Delta 1]|nr:hypothetical protein D1BOALGB6SA_1723 [Olavius sp. associated proteobacterium Delta 1]
MNTKDENMVFSKIADIQKSIHALIAEFSEKQIISILNSQFGLSSQDSRQLLRITQDMVASIPNDALPEDWFFKPAPSQMRLGVIKKYKSKIRNQRNEVQCTVDKFRKLSDEQRDKVLNYWPKKYWNALQGNLVYCDIKGNIVDFDGEEDEVDFDGETYNENQKMPSALIANNIIAERWNSTPNTIETYCK